MSNKKRQHYIPQFYLRLFSNQETGKHLLWQYDINTGMEKYVSTKDICCAKHFYDLPSKDDHYTEELLSKAEYQQYIFIQNLIELINADSINQLNATEIKTNISALILFNLVRTQASREYINKNYIQATESIATSILNKKIHTQIKELPDNIDFKVKAELTPEGIVGSHLMIFTRLPDIASFWAENGHFEIVKIINRKTTKSNENSFITTDTVCRIIHKGHNGLIAEYTMYIMPITPDICILMYDPQVMHLQDNDVELLSLNLTYDNDKAYFDNINYFITTGCKRFLYSPFKGFEIQKAILSKYRTNHIDS